MKLNKIIVLGLLTTFLGSCNSNSELNEKVNSTYAYEAVALTGMMSKLDSFSLTPKRSVNVEPSII